MSLAIGAKASLPPRVLPLAVLGLLAVAVLALPFLPGFGPLNRDTVWLIEAAEQWLSGKALYSGVVETNPPMSILLYVPAVALARALGLASEPVVALWCLALAAMSAALSAGIIRRAGWFDPRGRLLVALGLFVLLAFMPKQVFSQREHLAGAFSLPFLLLLLARHEGRPLPRWTVLFLAGAGAGLAVCIKPHFLLAFALPALASAIIGRSLNRLVTIEALAAALVVAVYGAALLLVFGDYQRLILPLMADVYLPARIPLLDYLVSPLTLIFLLFPALAFFVLQRPADDAKPWLLIAAALGFFIAYLLQGKGWVYHLYPALLLIGAAALFALAEPERRLGVPRQAALSLLFAGFALIFAGGPSDYPRLRAALSGLPQGAPVLIVTPDLGVPFPLIRQQGLVWASRSNAVWLAGLAYKRRQSETLTAAEDEKLDLAIAQERRWLAEDITANRPEIIVFDTGTITDWERFALDDAVLAALFTGYSRAESFAENDSYQFIVYRRK